MQRLHILWQRLLRAGETCERCGDTGETLRRAAEILRGELAPRGVAVELEERALSPDLPDLFTASNRVFLNGTPLEEWLEAKVGSSDCPSCQKLLTGLPGLDAPVCCRTLVLDGREYESPPLEVLLRAGRRAAQHL